MIDRRLALLARASARLILVEQGVMSLDEAFEPLVPVFYEAIGDGQYWAIYDALGRRRRRLRSAAA
jgi:hypothetical protein